MHVVVIRGEVCEANPWVPVSLMKAFTTAKNNSLERALTFGTAYPIPMHAYYALEAQKRLGKDFFPYGIEPNRTTLEAFLKFARDQGVCHRLLKPEEMFAPQVVG
jgi:4,5-dihydroxyphthalate decarboxylase